ncbi:hypothetical protein [Georgenia alba]|uniref:Uncharacterized protein n=1 Tax=Georgenia alba TaxID=2233858 RepID=A0ABW2QAX8_9MICO
MEHATSPTATVEVTERAGAVRVQAADYQLEVRADPPRAVLADRAGRIWSHLSLLATLDRTDVPDDAYGVGAPDVRRDPDGTVEVSLTTATTAWQAKRTSLRCTPQEVTVEATVTGRGTLGTVCVLGGRGSLASGACGPFWSSIEHASVFSPAPSEPVQVVRPARSAVVLGALGDASPGRLHAVFSPPPLCLALGREPALDATGVPAGEWLGLWVRAAVEELTFTSLRYDTVDGGFRILLDYDGHTRVEDRFTTPTLVLRPAASPHEAIERYRADLVARGLAPPGPGEPAARWWEEPIFCGWGAQCALAPLPGAPSSHPYHLDELAPATVPDGVPTGPDMARQDVYDDLLARLEEHGVVPGTIVLDDRWQEAYGTAGPDPGRWPDLRAWVASRHARGQRVLLWWKAWDAAGLPPEECLLDAAGTPVAVDPGSPAYRARLRITLAQLLGPDGIDADGLKIDFTQRSPAGPSLHPGHPGSRAPWGIAGLHTLLRTIYRAAKAAKPDALVITHTPHPSFADVCDMVRTNDVLERDPAAAPVPVADQLRARVAVVRAALPGHLVDTDQWPMPDRAAWQSYVRAQADLGVPALYYVDRMDRSGEPLTPGDLALVATSWRRYRETR